MLLYILLAVSPMGLLAQTSTIHVRLVDGRTGKNLSGMNLAFVDYYSDRDGTPCTRQKRYDSDKGTYGNEHLYPVSTIVALGLVTKNNCSRRTATAKPGELVIFIRPATWWEKVIWGMES